MTTTHKIRDMNDCEPYMLTNINLLKYCRKSSEISDYSNVYTKNIIKTVIGVKMKIKMKQRIMKQRKMKQRKMKQRKMKQRKNVKL